MSDERLRASGQAEEVSRTVLSSLSTWALSREADPTPS